MSATQKVKIAARLRPRLDGELVDDSIEVFNPANPPAVAGPSARTTPTSASFISVANPRDPTQVFNFP